MSNPKLSPLLGAYNVLPKPLDQAAYMESTSNGPCRSLHKVLTVAILVTFITGFTVPALWPVLRPNEAKVYASRATLTQFDLCDGQNLHYKFTVNLVLRNTNRRGGIYCDLLQASSYYEGVRFGWVVLPRFYQKHRSIMSFPAVFEGMSLIALGSSGMEEFDRDKKEGFFDVEVRIRAWFTYKIGWFKIWYQEARIRCDSKRAALVTNGTSDDGFRGTRCDVDI